MGVLLWRRRERGDADGGTSLRDDDGFTVIETSVALGLIFTVLLGLLASLNTGVRGLLTGRQRTGGTAIVKEVVEQARAADYDRLGHDLTGDVTLATDDALGGTSPNWTYQPEGVGAPEPLVGTANPTYASHDWTLTRDGGDYAVRVYVTAVSAASGDDHKRLTVAVEWEGEQYDESAVENEVRVSTFVSRFGVSTGSEVDGVVDVDSGSVGVTGTIAGASLSRAELFLPYAHSDADGHLVNEARGFAGSARGEIDVSAGTATGCSGTGTAVTCDGAKAETVADNDGGTAFPLQDEEGPTGDAGGDLNAGTALLLELDATAALTSESSAESCVPCTPSVGDGDALLYGASVANGPASMAAAFDAGLVAGNLVQITDDGYATSTIDADAAATDQRITSAGRLVVPQVDLVMLTDGPLGFTAGVRVESLDVTATSQAGPAAVAPSVTGDPITVTVYDTGVLGLPEYREITVTPGTSLSDSANVTFTAAGATVTLETTIVAGQASTSSESEPGTITQASASLTNWFVVTTHVQITELGVVVADLLVELDYGRIATTATYEA